MAEESSVRKLIRMNPEAARRLKELKADIPVLEKQIEALSGLMDVSPLKEKLEWAKKAGQILEEHFT